MRWIAIVAALSGCLVVTDFEVESSTVATTSTGGAAGGATTGGAGGSMSCDNVDLTSDEDNCGSCGFACGSNECVDGRCAEMVELQGGEIRSVLVDGDTVFVAQRNADGSDTTGTLKTLPRDFTSTTTPELNHSLDNAIGAPAFGAARCDHRRAHRRSDLSRHRLHARDRQRGRVGALP